MTRYSVVIHNHGKEPLPQKYETIESAIDAVMDIVRSPYEQYSIEADITVPEWSREYKVLCEHLLGDIWEVALITAESGEE